MLGFLKGLFSSGVIGSVERLASEAIETDKETAEAKSLFIKTLDPNGIMRRDISRNVTTLYSLYVITMLTLIVLQFFGLGSGENITLATEQIESLFLPITGLYGAIVTASFGVNSLNAYKGK